MRGIAVPTELENLLQAWGIEWGFAEGRTSVVLYKANAMRTWVNGVMSAEDDVLSTR